ncbi:MAG: hypothetical protein IPK67_12540 [Planctomycetes bacterium]|nr:hypothetical protein [Planctomycetota bacterium]
MNSSQRADGAVPGPRSGASGSGPAGDSPGSGGSGGQPGAGLSREPERNESGSKTSFRAAPPRWFLGLLALAFLLAGVLAFDDYGLGWDDGTSRAATGQVNWNFVTRGVSKTLLEGNEKYHGPAYELFLLALEKVLFLDDLRSIYQMRHLAMFLTFALAVAAFHDLARRLLARPWSALAASSILVLSPRIFAESFVNSKDLAFLSFSILAAWTLLRALEKPSAARLGLHALAVAWLIDIRILGVLHAAVTAAAFAVEALRGGRAAWPRWIARSLLSLALCAGLVVLFWPVLWLGPWQHFRAALQEMSQYHWEGLVLYAGERVRSTELPWHYLPCWIFVTTPLLYTALFGVGVARQCLWALEGLLRPGAAPDGGHQGLASRLARLDTRWIAVAAFGFAPVLSVIALGSVVYDGWRHVYCVYPFLVLFAARGLEFLTEPGLLPRPVGRAILVVFAGNALVVGSQMAQSHPHQNVYFNEFAKAHWQPMGAHFELDYWGVAYRQGLEAVLALKPRPQRIRVAARNYACKMNFSILEAADRERLTYVESRAECDYYLSNFRRADAAEEDDPPEERKVHEIVVGGVPILAVYRMGP